MISVLIVDDHTYIRNGICYLIERTTDIEVVATATNGIEAVAKTRLHQPHVVSIDISMPLMNGLEATKQIIASCPRTRVLVLSIYDNPVYIEEALQAGASGYVIKDAIGDEILEAIRSLHNGKRYFSCKVAATIYPYLKEESNSWVV